MSVKPPEKDLTTAMAKRLRGAVKPVMDAEVRKSGCLSLPAPVGAARTVSDDITKDESEAVEVEATTTDWTDS